MEAEGFLHLVRKELGNLLNRSSSGSFASSAAGPASTSNSMIPTGGRPAYPLPQLMKHIDLHLCCTGSGIL